MNGRDHNRENARRLAALAADVMLAAALLVAISPWTSGAYTWVVQQRLRGPLIAAGGRSPGSSAETSAPASPATAASAAADPVWRGWEREDARDWRRAPEGEGIARLIVPKLRLDAVIVKGAHDAQLRRGPGWVAGTSPPGPTGNCGISGHRTTYLAPFRDIDHLQAGDAVRIETRRRTYTYRVSQRFFAERDDVDWLLPTRRPTLTLTSCHPPYSDRFRIVVTADLVAVAGRDR